LSGFDALGKVRWLAGALGIIEPVIDIKRYTEKELKEEVTDHIIEKIGPFFFKMFLADAISFDNVGNWNFISLGSRLQIVKHMANLFQEEVSVHPKVTDIISDFLSNDYIFINNIRLEFKNNFKTIAPFFKSILEKVKFIEIRDRIYMNTIEELIRITISEINNWINKKVQEGVISLTDSKDRRAILNLRRDIFRVSVTWDGNFIASLLVKLQRQSREIQSRTLDIFESPLFTFRGNEYSFKFSQNFIKNLELLNFPSIDKTFSIFSAITYDRYKKVNLEARHLIINENFNKFSKYAFNELLEINNDYNEIEGATIGTKINFMVSKYIKEKVEIDRSYISRGSLDFSKSIDNPFNIINLKKIYIALYYGYAIRLSKTDHFSNYGAGKENYIGEFNIFDISDDVFRPTQIERRIYNLILKPFMEDTNYPAALYFPPRSIETNYIYQMHLDSIGFVDLLLNGYSRLQDQLRLLNWIDFVKLNNIMDNSDYIRRAAWADFLMLKMDQEGVIPNPRELKINNLDQLKLFLRALLIDTETGGLFNYDPNLIYEPDSYTIHDQFYKVLYFI